MATVFLDGNESFVAANSDSRIFGRAGGEEAIEIEPGITGLTLDGNVEQIGLAAAAAEVTFRVNESTGRLALVQGDAVVATFGSGLAAPVGVRFSDGEATLSQTGATRYALDNGSGEPVTISTDTPQTGDATVADDPQTPDDTDDTDDTPATGERIDTTAADLNGAIIEGTSGNDRLVIDPLDRDTTPERVDGVRVVDVTGAAAAAGRTTLDASAMVGVEAFWSVASRGGDVAVAGIQAPATVGMRGTHDPITYTAGFAPSVLAGSDDTVPLRLEGVDARSPDQGAPEVRIDGAETVSVENTGVTGSGGAVGAGFLNVTGDSLETLTIAGDGELEIASDRPTLQTLDARAFAGSYLSVDLGDVTQGDLTARVSSSERAELFVDAELIAAGETDVSITMSSGAGDDAYAALAVGDVGGADALEALDFSAGTIEGVDLLAIGNDGNSGIRLARDATLDISGTRADQLYWIEGDALDLAGRALTIEGVAGDSFEISAFEVVTGDGTLIVDDVAALTIDPVRGFGRPDAPVSLAADAAADLTIDAADRGGIWLGTVDLRDGDVDQRDEYTLTLEGDNPIDGSLALGTTNVNRLTVDNGFGAGVRNLDLDGVADLKAPDSVGQAPGEGIVITGGGTGVVTLTAGAAALSGLAIDATGYGAGETVVEIDDWTPEVRGVDAEAFAGIDRLDISEGAFDARIQDLGEGPVVRIGADADLELRDGAAERDVVLANPTVSTLAANTAGTLNLQPTAPAVRLTDLEANGAGTINISTTMETGDPASLTIVDRFDARNGDRVETVAVNIDGAGDLVFEGGIDVGVPGERYVLSADGGGERDYGEVLLSSLGTDESLVFSGDSDYAATLVFRSTGQDAITVSLESDGNGILNALEGQINRGETLTLNSASLAGTGVNIVRDTSGFVIEDGARLSLIGNQALRIEDRLDLTQRDDDTGTLDASAFEGDLTIGLARDTQGGVSMASTVALGEGDDTLSLDPAGDALPDADTFTLAFAGERIGTDRIEGFAADAGVADMLDLTTYFPDVAGYQPDVAGQATRGQLENAAGDALVTFTDIDADGDGRVDDVRAASGAFDGQFDLIGVSNAELSDSNFVGA